MPRARLPRVVLSALIPLLAVLLALPATAASPPVPPAGPAPAPALAPALAPAGRTSDGWEVLRLRDGALPSLLPGDAGLRAEVRLLVDGLPRAVRVLVPPGARRPAPVVVALHGLHQTVDAAEDVQRWGPLARREGLVLVQGIGHRASWNAGACCGGARDEDVDDVAYLDRVLELVAALHPVDPRRVHVTGFSNGAMMAYRYACERRSRVAGVLAVAGTVTSSCLGRSDVAVLHVHGLADRTVPLQGTAYSTPLRTGLRPVSRTTAWFGPRITAQLLRGYGHGWPSSARGGYDATGRGWAWLAARPKPAR